MNEKSYITKTKRLLKEARASLSPDTLRQFDEATIEELIKTAFVERLRAEARKDPEYDREVIRRTVHREVVQYFEEQRPSGHYDVDALIPVSDECWMHMPMAKREDLLAWSALESDGDNLRYISERLLLWDEAKYSTLEDLERALAEEAIKS